MSSAKAKCLDGDDCQVRVIHLDRVEQARRETVSGKELNWLASIYKVLGDPSRLKIVMALRNVEMCVCDLAAFLGLTESAISHQLRRFKDLALVRSRREGQVIYYSLDDEHVAKSFAMNEAEMKFLEEGLTAMGLKTIPSQANFIYCDVGMDGASMYDALLQEGVIVRHIRGSMIRVTIGQPTENRRLLQALEHVLPTLSKSA